jgi:hypothetical protein
MYGMHQVIIQELDIMRHMSDIQFTDITHSRTFIRPVAILNVLHQTQVNIIPETPPDSRIKKMLAARNTT